MYQGIGSTFNMITQPKRSGEVLLLTWVSIQEKQWERFIEGIGHLQRSQSMVGYQIKILLKTMVSQKDMQGVNMISSWKQYSCRSHSVLK